jgi:ribosomal protein S18 acetylase RimI-like enzyme
MKRNICVFSRIRSKFIDNGVHGIVLAFISRLPGIRAICVYYVYRLPFNKLILKNFPADRLKVLPVQDASRKDISSIQDKAAIFVARLQMNHFCFLAYLDGEPVGYLWGQSETVHIEGRFGFEIPIQSHQVFYYDSYTLPQCRNMGVGRALIQDSIEYFKNNLNKSELIAIIETSNLLSQKAYERMGFFKESMHFHLNIMGKKIDKKLRNIIR